MATNVTQSDIAFCILYNFGYRLTWAVLPWSIVALSWLSLLPRIRRLQVQHVCRDYGFLLIINIQHKTISHS